MKLGTLLTLAAALAVAPAYSQEEEETEAAPADEAAAPAAGDDAAAQRPKVKFFATLPFCRQISGVVEVLRPGAAAWEPVEDGVRYALGTTFRTAPGARHASSSESSARLLT